MAMLAEETEDRGVSSESPFLFTGEPWRSGPLASSWGAKKGGLVAVHGLGWRVSHWRHMRHQGAVESCKHATRFTRQT